jgi:hypothetical protein
LARRRQTNRGGFSWNRTLGITRKKQRIARKTGIPLTKIGRERKVGRVVAGGSVVLPCLVAPVDEVRGPADRSDRRVYGRLTPLGRALALPIRIAR